MAEWATFTGITGVILVLLLFLARASTAALRAGPLSADESTPSPADSSGPESAEQTTDHPEEIVSLVEEPPSSIAHTGRHDAGQPQTEPRDSDATGGPATDGHQQSYEGPHHQQSQPDLTLSTPVLLANVAISQGLFGVLLITMAWYTAIPAWAFGLAAETLTAGTVGTGVAVGGLLYGLNEAAAASGRQQGVATPTGLREALAPETAAGWAVLLGVVLPVIAGFEELLFRGALIGVVHAGFGVSPWLLAIGSSVAFALGHGAQGRLGIVITGVLGAALAAAFLLTGSLVVVIVAHYVVNSLEFIVHEALEIG